MEKVFIKDKQGNKVLPYTHTSAVLDSEGNDLDSHLGAFEDEVRGLVDTPHQNYVTVATYSSLPLSGSEDTIYRVSNYDGSTSQVDTSVYSEYAWDGTQYIFLCVKSQVGDVFDITVYNNNTKYADLTAALGTNGANIPESLRKGGMSVKFVQSSDNKYVQFRYKLEYENTPAGNASFVNTDNWAICEDSTLVECPEFIAVYTDADGKIIVAVENDGNIYYGAGVPQQVIDYINEKIAELSLDEYEDMVAFLDDLEKGDKTLRDLLNEKVDKEEGKSLIDTEYAEGVHHIDNPEFVGVWLDAEDKILFGVQTNGNFLFGCGVPQQVKDYIEEKISSLSLDEYEDMVSFLSDYLGSDTTLKTMIDGINDAIEDKLDKEGLDPDALNSVQAVENPEFMEVELDANDKVLSGRKVDGTKFENNDVEFKGNATVGGSLELNGNATVGGSFEVDGAVIRNSEDPEGRLEIATDSENKIISYRKDDGTLVENVGIESPKISTDSLNLSESGMTDFQQALKDSGFKPGGGGDWSDKTEIQIPEPRLAFANITGVTSMPTAKGVDAHAWIEVYDGVGNFFKKRILLNAQGNSSMGFEKKNFAADFCEDEWEGDDTTSIKIGSWVSQDSFHFKSYYTDFIRGNAVVSYQLCDEILRTRGCMADRPWKKALIDYSSIVTDYQGENTGKELDDLSLQTDTGARCFPDGFPCLVYLNGEFYGIFCWQLKKHRDNMHQDKKTAEHIHLDGDLYTSNLWDGTINWTAFEVRNPKSLYCMDGSKYDGDNPKELIDSTSEYYDGNNKDHKRTAKVKKYIEDLSGRIAELQALQTVHTTREGFPTVTLGNFRGEYSNSVQYGRWEWIESDNHYYMSLYDANTGHPLSDTEYWQPIDEYIQAIRDAFETYFDVDNLVDYQIGNLAVNDTDGFGKNWQWTTYDGTKWWCNFYDKDMSFGVFWTGSKTVPVPNGHWLGNDINTPMGLAIRYYRNNFVERWKYLREKGFLTYDHIYDLVQKWIERVGYKNYEAEYDKWPEAPCNRDSNTNPEYWQLQNGVRTYYDRDSWSDTSNYSVGNIVKRTARLYEALVANVGVDPATDDGTTWKDITWNANKSYSVNDRVWYGLQNFYEFKAVKVSDAENPQPPITEFYDKWPYEMGYRDSIWRYSKYIKALLENINNFIDSL